MEESWVSVEPEIGQCLAVDTARLRSVFPLRYGKVQRPVLPPDTLSRDRLFAWLDSHISRRVVYLVAEAGFGKTTLIADYARRSRLRAFWYRLDEDDTDGLAFLRYLVASCQMVDPDMLPRTSALLTEPSLEPLRQDDVSEALLSEVETLGDMSSILVLDDFHIVESNPSITGIVERLIDRLPRGLAVVVASRREPPLCVASLRSRGQMAQLGWEDLRFSERETEQLFRDAYHMPLEADVLRDLNARTDGWAASLQLVKTAVEGRTPSQIRGFVHSLSGAKGDLYDYLAEEVVGDLEPKLRDFLLRVSLLEEMDPVIAAVAGDVSSQRAHLLMGEAERLGLLSRSEGAIGLWRYHPLVREYLSARLELELGSQRISEMHRLLAAALEPRSWRLAARQWALSGDLADVRRVICSAIPTIIGTGDCSTAEELIALCPESGPDPWRDILRSRQHAAQGRFQAALALAQDAAHCAVELAPDDQILAGANALNLLCLGIQLNNSAVRSPAAAALRSCDDEELAAIGRATELLTETSEDGSLDELCAALRETVAINRARGHARHEGITMLNLAHTEWVRGNARAAAESGRLALSLLERCGNSGDVAVARLNTAMAMAHLGEGVEWRELATGVVELMDSSIVPDAPAGIAELEALYGDPGAASRYDRDLLRPLPDDATSSCVNNLRARVAMLHLDFETSRQLLSEPAHHDLVPGFRSAGESLRVQLRAMESASDESLVADADAAADRAGKQQAWFWFHAIRATSALCAATDRLNAHFDALSPGNSAFLSIQAELVVRRLGDLGPPALEVVRSEATLRPERWRWAIRQMLEHESLRPLDVRRAASLLEIVGNGDDVPRLRKLARVKGLKLPEAGLALAKKLAPAAYVDDLGRVEIHIGARVVRSTDIRRKVLSLLTYLLTRPQFSAPREQVMDALWPEMEPEQGANSLNQTAYFLRQVFEPKGGDDASAGYLNCTADLIWLDPALVSSRSGECLKLISTTRRDFSPALVAQLADKYTGKFAVDFPYDDWAAAFRDSLHASYLDRVERSIVLDTKAGAFDRALITAQLALAADPDADQIELCLLRLYRRTGANAAAAEQYAHYASVLRDQLGIEPPPLNQI